METKRQAKGFRALAAALSKVTRAVFRRRGFAHAGVLTQWPAIVGPELAARSCPEKLTFPPGEGRGGTLHLRVASGFATELQHFEPLVCERINTYFGFPAVERIRIKQGPLPERKQTRRTPRRTLGEAEEAALGESVAGTGDPGLREALHGLGRRLAASAPAPKERDDRDPAAGMGGGRDFRAHASEDRS